MQSLKQLLNTFEIKLFPFSEICWNVWLVCHNTFPFCQRTHFPRTRSNVVRVASLRYDMRTCFWQLIRQPHELEMNEIARFIYSDTFGFSQGQLSVNRILSLLCCVFILTQKAQPSLQTRRWIHSGRNIQWSPLEDYLQTADQQQYTEVIYL